MTDSIIKYQIALSEQRTVNDDMHDAASAIWHQLEWENLLIPGPSSIAILGKITIVGLMGHITFAQGKKPYNHLNSLDFRMGVLKLVNKFIDAFSMSRTNMTKLTSQCGSLLDTMQKTISLVLEYDMEGMSLKDRNNEITQLLPGLLEQMLESINRSDKYVTECVTGFQNALATAQDLEEALTYTFGASEEHTKLLELREAQLKKHIAGAAERREIASKYLEDFKKARDLAEKRFDKCLDNFPKGGEMLALMAGERAVEMGSQASSMFVQKHMNPTPPAEEIDFSDAVFVNADTISDILTIFKSVVASGNSVNWNAVIAPDGTKTSLSYIISTLDELAEDNNNYGKFTEAQEAKKITLSALENANKLKGFAKDRNNPDVQTIVSSVKTLSSRANKLSATVSLKLKRPAVSTLLATSVQPPQAPQASKTDNKIIVQAATENAQFAVVKAGAQLDASRECYAKANESMLQLTKELEDFNVEIAGINPNKFEWEKVRKVLGQVIAHLSQLVYPHTQLSEFLSCIRSTVTEVLRPRVAGFVKRAGTRLDDLKGLTFDIYAKKTFAKDCIDMASLTFVMQKISRTYVTIYDSQVSRGMDILSKIRTNPNDEDQRGIAIEFGKVLEEWSLVAPAQMRNILQSNLQSFNENLNQQKEKIGRLAAILPPPPLEMKQVAETAKIEEVAKETAVMRGKH